MKKILGCLLLLFTAAGLLAQQPRVAIAPFNAASGISASEAEEITNAFYMRLKNKKELDLVYNSVTDRVMREHNFRAWDWSNKDKTAKLGEELKADWIVHGVMEKLGGGSSILVTIEFYDLRTLENMSGGDPIRIVNADDAYDKMDSVVDKLLEAIGGLGSSAAGKNNRGGAAPAGFIRIGGGTFMMGGNNSDSEKPVHSVTVKSFSMSKYQVTQKEWMDIMGSNPSHFKGDNLPVEQVSWHDAIEYCNKRSLKENLKPAYRGSGNNITCDWNANGYRLPTEAEWEYAAKGGNKDHLTVEYSGSNNADAVAWYDKNSGGRTHSVGEKSPNNLGLYDMSGNVWEWCWDWYGSYSSNAQTDPVGASSGSGRGLRGGSWNNSAVNVRSAYRNAYTPSGRNGNIGVRLVRP